MVVIKDNGFFYITGGIAGGAGGTGGIPGAGGMEGGIFGAKSDLSVST